MSLEHCYDSICVQLQTFVARLKEAIFVDSSQTVDFQCMSFEEFKKTFKDFFQMFEIKDESSIQHCLECLRNHKNHGSCHEDSEDSGDEYFEVQSSEESLENSVLNEAFMNSTTETDSAFNSSASSHDDSLMVERMKKLAENASKFENFGSDLEAIVKNFLATTQKFHSSQALLQSKGFVFPETNGDFESLRNKLVHIVEAYKLLAEISPNIFEPLSSSVSPIFEPITNSPINKPIPLTGQPMFPPPAVPNLVRCAQPMLPMGYLPGIINQPIPQPSNVVGLGYPTIPPPMIRPQNHTNPSQLSQIKPDCVTTVPVIADNKPAIVSDSAIVAPPEIVNASTELVVDTSTEPAQHPTEKIQSDIVSSIEAPPKSALTVAEVYPDLSFLDLPFNPSVSKVESDMFSSPQSPKSLSKHYKNAPLKPSANSLFKKEFNKIEDLLNNYVNVDLTHPLDEKIVPKHQLFDQVYSAENVYKVCLIFDVKNFCQTSVKKRQDIMKSPEVIIKTDPIDFSGEVYDEDKLVICLCYLGITREADVRAVKYLFDKKYSEFGSMSDIDVDISTYSLDVKQETFSEIYKDFVEKFKSINLVHYPNHYYYSRSVPMQESQTVDTRFAQVFENLIRQFSSSRSEFPILKTFKISPENPKASSFVLMNHDNKIVYSLAKYLEKDLHFLKICRGISFNNTYEKSCYSILIPFNTRSPQLSQPLLFPHLRISMINIQNLQQFYAVKWILIQEFKKYFPDEKLRHVEFFCLQVCSVCLPKYQAASYTKKMEKCNLKCKRSDGNIYVVYKLKEDSMKNFIYSVQERIENSGLMSKGFKHLQKNSPVQMVVLKPTKSLDHIYNKHLISQVFNQEKAVIGKLFGHDIKLCTTPDVKKIEFGSEVFSYEMFRSWYENNKNI